MLLSGRTPPNYNEYQCPQNECEVLVCLWLLVLGDPKMHFAQRNYKGKWIHLDSIFFLNSDGPTGDLIGDPSLDGF